MHVIQMLANLIFVVVSFKFITYFNKEVFDDALVAAKKYKSFECPANTILFKLKANNTVFKVQIVEDQQKEPKYSFVRCEVESLEEVDIVESDGLDINDITLFENACRQLKYDAVEFEDTSPHIETTNRLWNTFFDYWLEVVKGPPLDPTEPHSISEEWSVNTLVEGIFPGTKWCGFGNIADDIYSSLGEHAGTDACCRAHDLCRPIIRAFTKKYYWHNPSILPVSHCRCDMDLYNCLKNVGSPASKTIGKIFYDLVKMRCFDFDIKEVCTNRWFGFCLASDRKCVAVVKNNKPFSTYEQPYI